MAALEDAMDVGQRVQRDKAVGQDSLFGSTEMVSSQGNGNGKLPEVNEWDEKLRLSFEKEALGFYITGHPLDRYRDDLGRYTTCEAAALPERRDQEEVRLAGMVSGLKELTTRKGDRMAFLTLEDLSGFAEVVIFPEAYRESYELIKGDDPLLVTGNVKVEEESCKVLAAEIVPLAEASEKMTHRVHFRCASKDLDQRRLTALKDLMKRHRGSCEALLHVVNPPHTETVISLPEDCRVAANERIVRAAEKLFGYSVVTFE